MDAVFYTTFYRTNGPGHHAAFYVDNLPLSWKTIEEYLAVCAEELEEEWGEPDWSSSQTPNSFGCICYNIRPQLHEKLINLWRKTFCEEWPQCVVGPVCLIDAHTVKITDMLQTTKDAYEHQQAQLLRNTLNAHVSDGLVAQSKKM